MNDDEFEHVFESVARALSEDIGGGDVTARLIPADAQAAATVTAKESGVICGRPWFDRVFAALDPRVEVRWHVDEGELVDQRRGHLGRAADEKEPEA